MYQDKINVFGNPSFTVFHRLIVEAMSSGVLSAVKVRGVFTQNFKEKKSK